jgi:hypothetical protein
LQGHSLSLSTEDATCCGIEPVFDNVCVHTGLEAVVFDNAERTELNWDLTKLREGELRRARPPARARDFSFFDGSYSARHAHPWASASLHPMKVWSIFITPFPKHDASPDPACTDASGPSLQQQPSQSHSRTVSPRSKKPRKDPQSSDATPEKRGAMLKKSCPKNIQDRVARVMSQR